MATFSFNATEVAPQDSSFDLIPAGTYTAVITGSTYEPLKSGNGHGVKLTLEIIDGTFKNRKLWAQLNVKHTNEVAQKIGQQQLSSICHAVGVLNMQDTAQLHNKPIKVRVKVRKDEQYGDKNEVSAYESAGGASTPSMTTSTPTASKTAPWAKAA